MILPLHGLRAKESLAAHQQPYGMSFTWPAMAMIKAGQIGLLKAVLSWVDCKAEVGSTAYKHASPDAVSFRGSML